MATITKRNAGWLVQIRRKGVPPQSRMFRRRAEALEWARAVEAKLDTSHKELDSAALDPVSESLSITCEDFPMYNVSELANALRKSGPKAV